MLSKNSSELPFIIGITILVINLWFPLFNLDYTFFGFGFFESELYFYFIFIFLTGYLILRGVFELVVKHEAIKIVHFFKPTKRKIIYCIVWYLFYPSSTLEILLVS